MPCIAVHQQIVKSCSFASTEHVRLNTSDVQRWDSTSDRFSPVGLNLDNVRDLVLFMTWGFAKWASHVPPYSQKVIQYWLVSITEWAYQCFCMKWYKRLHFFCRKINLTIIKTSTARWGTKNDHKKMQNDHREQKNHNEPQRDWKNNNRRVNKRCRTTTKWHKTTTKWWKRPTMSQNKMQNNHRHKKTTARRTEVQCNHKEMPKISPMDLKQPQRSTLSVPDLLHVCVQGLL